MARIGMWIAVGLLAVAMPACRTHRRARPPVTMVSMQPPADTPHAQASVPVGGSVTFEAEHVVSCESDVPDLFRAYATTQSLTLLGRKAGRGTLHLRIQAGDEFYLDVDVTSDEPARRALAVGEQLPLPLDDVKDTSVTGDAVTTAKSSDGTQLFVTAVKPGIAIVVLEANDGTPRPVDILVISGTRLL
ncbi:MAG: hypothetical protein KIT84_28570 [Labilithrix sp.]|nr:hypothetical protein [Labilithrix sp.]MCW5815014.1 hypothetical protein [Labilithrix sp.]